MSQPELFEDVPASAPAQRSLFEGGNMDQAVSSSYIPNPADVRRRLNAVLETARNAERIPWRTRDACMWQTVFPQMANWLPEGEVNRLRLEFAKELERLQSAS